MKRLFLLLAAAAAMAFPTVAGARQNNDERKISNLSWRQVATRMPDEWYGSQQAAALADTVLDAQISCGGWFKNLPYHKLEPKHRRELAAYKRRGIGIFDNNSTTVEMRFLARVYAHNPQQRWADGFRRALDFVFAAQYPNGGWPMFWPLTEECIETYGVRDPVSGKKYVGHITFNDNAIVNLMHLLREVYERRGDFAALTDDADDDRARKAFFDGIQCILDCQIHGTYEQYEFARTPDGGIIWGDRRTGDGPLTVWCAQHDAETLEPAQARAYEYPSYCGGESADILRLLMSVRPEDIPADRPQMWEGIKRSVIAAVEWFDAHRIEGKRWVDTQVDGEHDRVLVDAPGERDLWARFYELTTCRPIFGMYDFVRQYDISEISAERRCGYGWYSTSLKHVVGKEYRSWRAKYVD